MTQCAPGSRKIILAVACYAMAAGSTMMLGTASCLSVIAADTRFGLISFTIWG